MHSQAPTVCIGENIMSQIENMKSIYEICRKFSDSISFYLMEDPPLPEEVSDKLWDIVNRTNDTLNNIAEISSSKSTDFTFYIPKQDDG